MATSTPRRRNGLLLVPEFPYDSFWSYRYVMRLVGRRAAFPPLGLLTFAGYLDDTWDLELVDLNVRAPGDRALRDEMARADAVFLTAMSIQKRSLVRILSGPAAGLDTPFVLGGPFASSYRDQILEPGSESDEVLHEGLDMLVWGEAGGSIRELLDWLDEEPKHTSARPGLLIPRAVSAAPPGSQRHLLDRALFRPLDATPTPRWDLIRPRDYHSLSIQTTAGCPFRCDFCDIIQFNGGFNRPRSPATVRRELEAILDTGYRGSVFSVDDNFIGSPDGISSILDAMTEFQREHGYPFTFFTQASVNLGKPKLRHLVDKMKRAGFDAVFLGIENPEERALRRMNKKQNIAVDVPETVALIQAAGIEVYAGFILGGDEDTPSTAEHIVDFVRRARIVSAMTGMLTPIPHTPLHRRLQEEGRLRTAEFSGNNTDDQVQFEPRGMSRSELRTAIHSVLERLFNRTDAYRRAADMLRVLRPHIFNRKRVQPRLLRAALVSLWGQGLRRLDRGYFTLLGTAIVVDWRLRRAARKEIRRLRRVFRSLEAGLGSLPPDGLERAGEALERAQDYLVRFRPQERLERVQEWARTVRERLSEGHLPAAEAQELRELAVRYLRVVRRRHRFPGATLAGAFRVAIKTLHYERVAEAIVGRRLGT